MCRAAYGDGVRMVAATAHVGDHFPQVTADRIRAATRLLRSSLKRAELPLGVVPCAEVRACPELLDRWRAGQFVSYADAGKYLLVEMPPDMFVDLTGLARIVGAEGVRIVVAHAERQEPLIGDDGLVIELIRSGCLIQICSDSLVEPPSRRGARAVRRWVKRGMAHVLGSDGHDLEVRRPLLADAYRRIARWIGQSGADRICSTNGIAVLQGLPLHLPPPERKRLIRIFSY